ncbi:MAG TPA: PD-(D/E)XK nuclease family protein, partial [Solirubrobacteraceae bacterium]|nr:PD-(D/E)XK nuclease family protein [Solirubrobacteraceae bacterium]
FSRLRSERGSAKLDAESLPQADAILDAELDRLAGQQPIVVEPSRRAAVLRRLRADLHRQLEREAGAGATLEPSHFELGFGLDDDCEHPAVELAGELKLRGRVDRIDIDSDRGELLVRDYKASRAPPVAAWGPDGRLQVALYMLAARELLSLEPIGGLYQPLSGRDPRARGAVLAGARERVGADVMDNDALEPQEFAAVLEGARDRAVALARELHGGRIHPCPDTCRKGGGCRYPGICRSQDA